MRTVAAGHSHSTTTRGQAVRAPTARRVAPRTGPRQTRRCPVPLRADAAADFLLVASPALARQRADSPRARTGRGRDGDGPDGRGGGDLPHHTPRSRQTLVPTPDAGAGSRRHRGIQKRAGAANQTPARWPGAEVGETWHPAPGNRGRRWSVALADGAGRTKAGKSPQPFRVPALLQSSRNRNGSEIHFGP